MSTVLHRHINIAGLYDDDLILIPTLEEEVAAHSSYIINMGYGQLKGVYATVQKGASVDLDVNVTTQAVSIDSFTQWKSNLKQFFSEEQWKEIEQKSSSAGGNAGYFGGLFGISVGGGIDSYKNKTTSETKLNLTKEQEGFLKSVYDLKMETLSVTGKIRMEGTSFIPVTASVYLMNAQVKFADNKFIRVLSSDNWAVVDEQGKSTDKAKVTGSLNVNTL